MSDEESIAADSSNAHMLSAQYKNGQLQIVEVTPFNKSKKQETHILPDVITAQDSGEGHKLMQVMDADKGLVQLDLLNLTLVRCEGGEDAYRLVSSTGSEGGDVPSDTTVACVLQSSDGEDQDNQESYMMVEAAHSSDPDNQDSYVMVEGSQGPMVFLQSGLEPETDQHTDMTEKQQSTVLTPAEILEKAKAIQKAKALMVLDKSKPSQRRGRKRKGALPPPHELLSSPNFKLFLYSCKMCSFKCNAVKELTAHKATEHSSGGSKIRAGGPGGRGGHSGRGGPAIALQCARCPFRGGTHTQLMKHVHDKHLTESNSKNNKISLSTKEVEAADVLVCGACGFESSQRQVFRRHIEDQHGATTT